MTVTKKYIRLASLALFDLCHIRPTRLFLRQMTKLFHYNFIFKLIMHWQEGSLNEVLKP